MVVWPHACFLLLKGGVMEKPDIREFVETVGHLLRRAGAFKKREAEEFEKIREELSDPANEEKGHFFKYGFLLALRFTHATIEQYIEKEELD